MSSDISNDGGPVNRASQLLGQAEEEDAVISLVLKKEYCDIDESSDNRLLWKSHVEKVIKSGTLTRLVQQLAPHGEELDHSYRTSFLAVYRTFTTPAELLQELILRFNQLQTNEDKKFKDSEICITLRSILSFIRLWLEKYITDFNHPPSYDLLTLLEQFLTQQASFPMIANETSELLRHVLELRQKLMYGDLVPVNGNGTTEERAIDDLYDWLSFKPVQIAWDLTALDADMFGSLVPHQCLHYIRHQMDQSPSIYRSIEHFNKVICLVITTVLQPSISRRSSCKFSASYDGGLSTATDDSSLSDSISGDEHDRSDSFPPSDSRSSPPPPTPAYPSSHALRGKCISHWIDVAQQCRLLKNFSSLKAIVFGLQSSSVSRLHHSWSTISNERQITFEELLSLFSSDSNFQIFREVLNKEATGKRADVQSPHKKSKLNKHKMGPGNTAGTIDVSDVVIGVIPYLGTFLSDLTMIHTALPDRNKDGQINFEKRRKEFEILAKISLFQTASSKYNLPKNPSLYHWIYHTPLLTEDESYQLSVELEPPLLSPVDKSPFSSSPRSVKSSSPLCESIIRRSLRLLKNTGKHVGKKTGALSVPSDPRLRKSFDNTVSDDIESDLDGGGAIYRSSSCFELNERVIIRVSISEHEDVCKYKSIYLSKSDHTSKVIQASLEKYGLPVEEANKYQLSQQLKDGLSVIPEGACVYYALDNTQVLPDLYIQLIKDLPPTKTKTTKAKSNRN